jgi:signal transduction histidine kinase
MRERVTLVAGEMTITSEEGKGTVVSALIPVNGTTGAALPLSEAG